MSGIVSLGIGISDLFFFGLPACVVVISVFKIRPLWIPLVPAIAYLPFQLIFATLPSLYYLLVMGAPSRLDVSGETVVWFGEKFEGLNVLLYVLTEIPIHFVWPAILSYFVFRRADAGNLRRLAFCLTVYWALCVLPGWFLFGAVNEYID
ncbi:MAG: hypothetical protein WBC90_18225 [Albidovulum sp.]